MRWNVINQIINKYGFKSYLEIGVQDYYCNCDKIQVDDKTSVDPAPRNKCDYTMTSDEFFAQLPTDKKYDFCFVDGYHLEAFAYRDVINCLNHLSDGGIIMVHDCIPTAEDQQTEHIPQGAWVGTVWKAWAKLRCTRPDLFMCVLDTDWGCGIIKRGSQQLYNNGQIPPVLDWKYYTEHRNEMLNVVPVSEIENI